ncbi:MAG: UDP-N-acetylmuramoyl-L-alanine--D-glutamate ligase, partial [Solobacterium sp.]|nr:UDP-N-acetylmuramoyl-L-alanine--D-glutamate ligase [Solobacterium sp.]
EEGHYIALELSQGQLIDMFDFHPEVSTIINLTPDHIDFMGSLENYYASKTRIYQNTQKEDYFILNKDDEEVKKYIQKYPLPCSSISFSLENKEADAYIENGYLVKDGKAFLDLAKVTLPGKHNIQNIMIASLMCMCVGVKEEDIQDVVYHFSGVEHRIEFVKEIDGVKYYNDSKATNTDATITALKAFEKGVFLLVGGFEKGLAMDEVKKYLAPVKKVIGYGASGKRIAHDLVGEDAIVVNDLQEAILCAKELAMKGDVVLLSPTTSSFDQYTSFEERGKHFKRIVESL